MKLWKKKYEGREIDVERKFLFHSTAKTDPKVILQGAEGMDRNFASDSNFYGPGIYFAMWIDYSHFNSRRKFCHKAKDKENTYKIIIARAVVGRSKRLKMNSEKDNDKNKDKKPRKEIKKNEIGAPIDSQGEAYESIQDSHKVGPIMYVLLENEQVYPEYLATYQEDPPRQF